MAAQAAEKGRRSFGLAIALLAIAMLYGLMPLLPIVLNAWIRAINMGGSTPAPTEPLSLVLAVALLAACLLTWIGWPRWAPYVLIALVWLNTLIIIIQAAMAPAQNPTGGSAPNSPTNIWLCQVPILVIISLYITWYLNRATVRAFYPSAP